MKAAINCKKKFADTDNSGPDNQNKIKKTINITLDDGYSTLYILGFLESH